MNAVTAPDQEPAPENQGHFSPQEVRDMAVYLRKVLYETNRYFWHVLKDMPILIVNPDDRQLPTMAVDQFRNLYINPRFATKILDGFIDESGKIITHNNPFTFVIAHEVYHVVNRTFERQHDRNIVLQAGDQKVTLWNIATDFEMNDELQWQWKLPPPKDGLLTNEQGIGEFMGKTYQIRGKSAERIYAEILKDLEANPNIKKGPPEPGEGDPQEGEGEPQDGEGEPQEGEGKPGKPGKGKPRDESSLSKGDKGKEEILKVDPKALGKNKSHDEMVDGNNAPDTLEGSDEKNTKDTQLDDIKRVTDRAKKEMEKQEAQREEGSGKTAKVGEFDIDKRNYRDVLKEIMGTPVNTGSRSYTKPIRRFATQRYAKPGKVSQPEMGNVILALDTSGSITRSMIAKFIGAAQNIGENYKRNNLKIRVVLYIEKVYKYVDFKPDQVRGAKLAKWLMDNIDTSGGNYFSQVMRDMHSMKDLNTFKGIIYLTDGFEYWDKAKGFDLPPMKNIFLISGPIGENFGNTEFLKYVGDKRPGGKTVDIYSVNLND